eukprot:126490_1
MAALHRPSSDFTLTYPKTKGAVVLTFEPKTVSGKDEVIIKTQGGEWAVKGQPTESVDWNEQHGFTIHQDKARFPFCFGSIEDEYLMTCGDFLELKRGRSKSERWTRQTYGKDPVYLHSTFGAKKALQDNLNNEGKLILILNDDFTKPKIYTAPSVSKAMYADYSDYVHHYEPVIGGEYDDVLGSGSPLLIGGVVGASAVVIIMLIFCLGLAFGMIIYWGYSQKQTLDVKRRKDEMRNWIDDEDRNEV